MNHNKAQLNLKVAYYTLSHVKEYMAHPPGCQGLLGFCLISDTPRRVVAVLVLWRSVWSVGRISRWVGRRPPLWCQCWMLAVAGATLAISIVTMLQYAASRVLRAGRGRLVLVGDGAYRRSDL